jgi:LysR family cys regulon transcriptional activator
VIKTYVALGLGVGIIAEMAFDPARDEALVAMPASHLFEGNTTRVGFRRDVWLRGYEYDFMELLAPQLTRDMVEATLKGEGADPGL